MIDDQIRRDATRIDKAEDCVLSSDKDVKEAFDRVIDTELACIDSETDGLGLNNKAVGISLSNWIPGKNEPWSVYIPWGHYDFGKEEPQANRDLVAKLMRQLIEKMNPDNVHFFHDRFDRNKIAKGLDVTFKFGELGYDVMHMLQLVEPNLPHGLKAAGSRYFGIDLSAWEGGLEAYAADIENSGHAKIPPSIEGPYAATDARITAALYYILITRVQELGLEKVLRLETSALPIIARASNSTIKVNQKALAKIAGPRLEEIKALKEQFKDLSGFQGDTNDQEQLREWLYSIKHYPTLQHDKNGQPSTGGWVIEKLAHTVPGDEEMLLILAQLRELETTYRYRFSRMYEPDSISIKEVPLDIAQISGNGYWASRVPDCSDWHAEDIESMKKSLVIPQGKTWVMIEAPQFPIALMARDSKDPNLQEVNNTGDIIKIMAEKIKITPQVCHDVLKGRQRGMGRATAARVFSIDEETVDYVNKSLNKTFPWLPAFYTAAKVKAEEGRPLITPWGRRVTMPLNSAYRAGGEWLIAQEADMWKWLGVKSDKELQAKKAGHMLFPIEHGLIFEVEDNAVSEFISFLVKENQRLYDRGSLPIPWQISAAQKNLSKAKIVKLPPLVRPILQNNGAKINIGI